MRKMNFKKLLNCASMCALWLSVLSASAEMQAQTEYRKFYLTLNLSALIIGDASLGGGGLSFAYMPTQKSLLVLDMNAGGDGSSKKIGEYSYTITTTYTDGTSKSETYNDGKVTYGYSFFEATLAYNRLFNVGKKWQLRLGPAIGLLTLTGSDNYSPTSYNGTEIKGLPKTQPTSKNAVTGGLIAGCTWNFAQRWFVDLNYRLSVNSTVNFPERNLNLFGDYLYIDSKKFGNIGNRINLSLGFRF